jgi:hypothetical protein
LLKLDSFIGGERITCPASKKSNKNYPMFMVWAAVCASNKYSAMHMVLSPQSGWNTSLTSWGDSSPLVYENGGANTDIHSGCVTAVVMHKEILDV